MHGDDDLLMLSGIQHIAFCERQWALIHVERQWAENVKTSEGNNLHERVDDPLENDKRCKVITYRAICLEEMFSIILKKIERETGLRPATLSLEG